MIETAETAPREHGKVGSLDDILHQRQISTAHRLLAVNGCHEDSGECQTTELAHQIENELRLSACPAVRENLSVAYVCSDDNLTGKELAHLHQPVRVFEGSCADDHSVRAVSQRLLNCFSASDSATNLHFSIGRAQDRLNLVSVITAAGHAIQINDMQMMEAALSPGHGYPA